MLWFLRLFSRMSIYHVIQTEHFVRKHPRELSTVPAPLRVLTGWGRHARERLRQMGTVSRR